MTTRHQLGYIFRAHGSWFVRYRERVIIDGVTTTAQVARKLGSTADIRTKTEARDLATEILKDVNTAAGTPRATMRIGEFVDTVYWPHARTDFSPSTLAGYEGLWARYLKPRVATTKLRDFRTWDGEKLLRDIIAARPKLSRNTMRHIKAFLSGVFKHARRHGYLAGANPMTDVSIPVQAHAAAETVAYSLEDELKLIAALPEPASVIVALASFSGLRKSEMRGLKDTDYHDNLIHPRRGYWETWETKGKSAKSLAPVPVIAPLAKLLDAHVATLAPGSWMFAGETGRPLNLDNLGDRVIAPIAKVLGIAWHGWHGFRRGIGTNLYRLGVPDITIQLILRHASVVTTRESYIKPSVSVDAVAAMRKLEKTVEKAMNAARRLN